MGPEAMVNRVLETVKRLFMVSQLVLIFLLQNLYKLVQAKMEKVQVFATHLEEAFGQISIMFPHIISECEIEHNLHNCLFYGMIRGLWDSIKYLYNDTSISFVQPMVTAQKAEG